MIGLHMAAILDAQRYSTAQANQRGQIVVEVNPGLELSDEGPESGYQCSKRASGTTALMVNNVLYFATPYQSRRCRLPIQKW